MPIVAGAGAGDKSGDRKMLIDAIADALAVDFDDDAVRFILGKDFDFVVSDACRKEVLRRKAESVYLVIFEQIGAAAKAGRVSVDGMGVFYCEAIDNSKSVPVMAAGYPPYRYQGGWENLQSEVIYATAEPGNWRGGIDGVGDLEAGLESWGYGNSVYRINPLDKTIFNGLPNPGDETAVGLFVVKALQQINLIAESAGGSRAWSAGGWGKYENFGGLAYLVWGYARRDETGRWRLNVTSTNIDSHKAKTVGLVDADGNEIVDVRCLAADDYLKLDAKPVDTSGVPIALLGFNGMTERQILGMFPQVRKVFKYAGGNPQPAYPSGFWTQKQLSDYIASHGSNANQLWGHWLRKRKSRYDWIVKCQFDGAFFDELNA